MIILKSLHEIAIMREANQIVAEILEMLKYKATPGTTTLELNETAEHFALV